MLALGIEAVIGSGAGSEANLKHPAFRADHLSAGAVYPDDLRTSVFEMHLVPDDGFDHDTSHVSMDCPCEPYLEGIPLALGGVYWGSIIKHREMRVPDHVPAEWTDHVPEDRTER